jgi:glucan 1,3-beta-glucosidase
MRPLTLTVLLIAALFSTWHWWRLGQPVDVVDAPTKRIACVSYAPFRLDGETPFEKGAFVPPARIEQDLRALSKEFDCVRTYSVGQGLAAVPAVAEKLGMKVLLGIWLGRDRAENERELKLGIEVAKQHRGTVRAAIVGNEVLLRKELPVETLAGYIRRVKAATGLTVTYADVWEFWLANPQIAPAVDFVTAHILPYWEDEPVAVENAVPHVRDVYAKVRAAFPGKDVLIGETGWPSAGRSRRGAVPSLVNEARFIRGFLGWVADAKVPYNVIEAFDQPWKRRLEGTVGGYWGLFGSNLEPKFALEGPVVEDRAWIAGIAGGALVAFAFLLLPALTGRPPGWRGAALLLLAGYATGGALAAQVKGMLLANRDALEWAVTGGYTALAFVTAFMLALTLAPWLDGKGPPAWPMSLAERRNPASVDSRWLGWSRFVWLFGAATVMLLLTFDARYRDFPLALFGPAGVGFALLSLIGVGAGIARRAGLEERVLATVVAVCAPAVLVLERPSNVDAVLWVALSLLLAAAVFLPGGRAGQNQHAN